MQGEGSYQGVPQVFVRFSGCNLNCAYCDTEYLDYKSFNKNELLDEIKLISDNKKIHSISITGGEPLLQSNFLTEFLPVLKQKKQVVYLETNGVLYKELEEVLPYVDIISMDFKLPSSTNERAFWGEHREFLKIAMQKKVFVKAVVTDTSLLEDWQKTIDLIAGISNEMLVILQPVTSNDKCNEPSEEKINKFRQIGLEKIKKVEVRRQLHKILGIK